MKRQKRLLLAIAALAGCGYVDHDQAASDRLVGSWYARSGDCTDTLVFEDDGAYSFDHACELDDGSVGQQVHMGGYAATAATVTLMPALVSCPELDGHDVAVGYGLDAAGLRVKLPRRALVLSPELERLPDPTPAGDIAFRFGCFVSDSTFKPHAYEKL